MKIEYEIQEEDFYEAHQLTLRSLTRWNRQWLWLVVGAIGLLLPVTTLLLREFEWVDLVTLPFATLLVVPWLLRRKIRAIFSKSDHMGGKTIADIDDVGFAISSKLGEGKMNWEAFEKYAEGPRVFALITPTRVFYIIPKRGLSDDQAQSLRTLISAHLPTKQRKA